jgi:hypothetical protein
MNEQSTPPHESGDHIADKHTSPELKCRTLPDFQAEDWNSVRTAFANADGCFLRQTWRDLPEAGLRPGVVKVGRQGKFLWILAEFEDEDIYNLADGPNQETWTLGDVFEIFVRPQDQESYFEFHFTPDNYVLALRFPSQRSLQLLSEDHETGSGLQPFFYDHAAIQSWTRVESDKDRWSILVALDCDLLSEAKTSQRGDVWLYSFSRYDYTRGARQPILSSSSAHQEPNYHLLGDWGQLYFAS